jgi:hypothetical protein
VSGEIQERNKISNRSLIQTATIKVKDYLNDIIRYDFNSTTNQFVVFSENLLRARLERVH